MTNAYKLQKPADRPCEVCQSSFTPSRPDQRLCGLECRKEQARRVSRKSAMARDERDRSPRPCRQCGVAFAPEYGNQRRLFCSDKCLKLRNDRVTRGKRRARKHGVEIESIDPIAIFERDGWCCYMCNTATPRELRGTLNDLAPELDHIIPLAVGGSHTKNNVACACRKCNLAKGSSTLTVAA